VHIKDAVPRDPAVDEYLARKVGIPGETARWLADICRTTIPGVKEAIWHGSPKFCLDDGTCIAYVSTHKDHANLGFIQGAQLEDPDGLLEGTGKGLRHIKLEKVGAVPKAKLVKLLRGAVAAAT
jgi:hypothetical protein